jgi:hypothetical protein
MKKTVLAVALLAVTQAAVADNSVSFGLDRVKDDRTGLVTHAQTLRAAFSAAGFDLGLNARTVLRADLDINPSNLGVLGGLTDRIEATVGRSLGPLSVYGGAGHEATLTGGRSWEYGVVGARTTFALGPFNAYAGAQARVNWDSAAPEQTSAYAGLGYNFTKNVGVTAGLTKSYRDIRETSYGAALKVSF